MPAAVVHDEAYLFARSIPEPNTGCWLWLLAIDRDGYAVGGPMQLVHRLAAKIAHGEKPIGLEVDHRCRMRSCVNPDHTRYLTHAENMLNVISSKTHCHRGHPLSGDNLRIKVRRNGRNMRQCRACARLSYHQRKERK